VKGRRMRERVGKQRHGLSTLEKETTAEVSTCWEDEEEKGPVGHQRSGWPGRRRTNAGRNHVQTGQDGRHLGREYEYGLG